MLSNLPFPSSLHIHTLSCQTHLQADRQLFRHCHRFSGTGSAYLRDLASASAPFRGPCDGSEEREPTAAGEREASADGRRPEQMLVSKHFFMMCLLRRMGSLIWELHAVPSHSLSLTHDKHLVSQVSLIPPHVKITARCILLVFK